MVGLVGFPKSDRKGKRKMPVTDVVWNWAHDCGKQQIVLVLVIGDRLSPSGRWLD